MNYRYPVRILRIDVICKRGTRVEPGTREDALGRIIEQHFFNLSIMTFYGAPTNRVHPPVNSPCFCRSSPFDGPPHPNRPLIAPGFARLLATQITK